jgi:hypothetical protein
MFRVSQGTCINQTITPQTDGTIAPADNGFPAATYSVCAQYNSGGTTRAYSQNVNTTTAYSGNSLVVFNIQFNGFSKTPIATC